MSAEVVAAVPATDDSVTPKKKLEIFTVFHKHIPPQIHQLLSPAEKYLITMYGVKKRVETKLNLLYEQNFPIYNPMFQRRTFNEGSAFYHTYVNRMHQRTQFIGFTQYDMAFNTNSINMIYRCANESLIFYNEFFEKWFLGGQSIIIDDFVDEDNNPIVGGLKSYNEFFGTNYTPQTLIDCKMPNCNTFVMSSSRFDKMMSWMMPYFNLKLKTSYTCPSGHAFNPGHIIEALTSMFLSLETADGSCRFLKMNIVHAHALK
jgi:hypothetical protein